MRHGADGDEAEFFGQINVAGAAQAVGRGLVERADNVLLPGEVVAAACAEIGYEEGRVSGLLGGGIAAQQVGLGLQPALALGQHFGGFEAAEVELIHNRQHENLEEHGLDNRPFHADAEPVLLVHGYLDEAAFELEQLQIIHKIAFNKAQTTQIVELIRSETQSTQGIELGFQLAADLHQRIHAFV